jgi:hypothetical protein
VEPKQANSRKIVSVGKKPVSNKSEVVETIAPEDWINEQADAAIEERKMSDEEPFLSLSNGYLNSRAYFCESPQFPDAARRAKLKSVEAKVRVIVGKYGGILNAEAVEGDAMFRSKVYQSLGSMTFRQSYFMGEPVRVEGLLNFNQNPTNSVLCRDSAQDVVVPAVIDGGNLNEFLQNCDILRFPGGTKTGVMNSTETRIRILVDEQGNVVETKQIEGSDAFGEAAKQAALKAKFRKSLIAGKAVKVRGELVFSQNSDNGVRCKNSAQN